MYLSGGILSGVLGTGVLTNKINYFKIYICWDPIWCSGTWCPNKIKAIDIMYSSGAILSGVLGTGVLTNKIN